MSEQVQPVYFFDASNGAIYLSEKDLPKKKSRLYLVFNREFLYYRNFSIDSNKRVKDNFLLTIQSHYIPFQDDYMNIIYGHEKGAARNFFFWVGPSTTHVEVESFFFDEVPESLIFKGDPAAVKDYRVFVFKRLSGYEVIYFDAGNGNFYSLFEKEESKIAAAVITLARKFSLQGTIPVLTEINPHIPGHGDCSYDFQVHQFDGERARYFFLPHSFPVKKKFSNISRSKQLKNLTNIISMWDRHLNIILVILLSVLLLNMALFFYLNNHKEELDQSFGIVQKMLNRADRVEFELTKIRDKISQYPDHMLYLQAVADAMDPEAVLIGYSLTEDGITIEGYSSNSLEILNGLRKSGNFKEVKFKSTVTKNVYSEKEKFEIEMVLPGKGGDK